MDYDVINKAIEDIVCIVNQYNRKKGYEIEICEDLLMALVGYYVTFGPEIFKMIDVVLEQLNIYKCNTELSCISKKQELRPEYDLQDSNPGTTWDYVFDDNNRFVGAIPNIVYYKRTDIQDVFVLVHELSHTLEGVKAEVLYENDAEIKVKHGFGEYLFTKGRVGLKLEGHGMTELATVTIENRILKDLLKLDESMIDNLFVKEFIRRLKQYSNSNVMLNSYGLMSVLFKDLIDNERFFELLRKYYYENEREFLAEEYEAMDERLSFEKIAYYADRIWSEEFNDIFYYSGPIQRQLDVLNQVTGFVPDQKILIIV